MFTKIMVPVDLAHQDKLTKSLECAAELARHFDIPVVYVGVTGTAPGATGHTPEEFASHLAEFAAAQAERSGISTAHHAIISHDPRVELDARLVHAAEEIGADLIVMEGHVPNVLDHFLPSDGGIVAKLAKATVMVVRN
ncbi:universal stress protein [Aliiruegeria lutimaris]|uniref:Nucleotide-binding universal stress protein, UspA family n=1 Tax=Aliiruegeria lutimaris TaxID=571298 RepID=A0A1G9I3T1_9RHOB|nr:universal stress protein [Aliiruegeria lutimaris]SDL19890.1 Nucleotide-binding universal stress protein, UspA family [Aliiruegeria lutimaris]